MSAIADRLAALGLVLPKPAAPVANYVGAVKAGTLVVVSGQLPFGADGKLDPAHKGKLRAGAPVDAAKAAARLCAINVLAQLQAVVGDLDQVTRVIRLGGFFAVDGEHEALPAAMNGASDFFGEVFGDKGRRRRRASAARRDRRGRGPVRDRALTWLTERPIAHRGWHGAGRPENSLSAARAAIARGFAIECDIQRTADGEAVVFHDATLERLTPARGRIADYPLAGLRDAPLAETG